MSYVGSSKDLYRRFKEYYNINYLNRRVLSGNSHIYKALISDGYGAFNLEILEYCSKELLIEREQYYIDQVKPEYNIQSIAGLVITTGYTTTIINKEDNSSKVYNSMRAAARDLRVNYSTLTNYV